MQVIGEREKKHMNKKTKKRIKYTDEPLEMKAIKDFLPPPDRLVLKDDTVKVTLALSRESVEFLKHKADENHVPYQKMIRSLVDSYVGHYNV